MIFTGSGKCFFFLFLLHTGLMVEDFSAIYSFLQGNGIAQRHPLSCVSLGVVCVCVTCWGVDQHGELAEVEMRRPAQRAEACWVNMQQCFHAASCL